MAAEGCSLDLGESGFSLGKGHSAPRPHITSELNTGNDLPAAGRIVARRTVAPSTVGHGSGDAAAIRLRRRSAAVAVTTKVEEREARSPEFASRCERIIFARGNVLKVVRLSHGSRPLNLNPIGIRSLS